jgi:hypothetical protein
MLYFINAENNREYSWHVGMPKPYMTRCSEVQADGDELQAIKDQFVNLPMSSKRHVVTWKSDFALLLVQHLRMLPAMVALG